MTNFKKVLCIGNTVTRTYDGVPTKCRLGMVEPGLTYYYKTSEGERLNWQTWQYEKTGKTVYHIYAAEYTDAWLFNIHDEKEFREIFKEI